MQLLRTQAARFLGWDQETWDKGSSPEVAFIVWEMLSTDQRSAATILGYAAAGEFWLLLLPTIIHPRYEYLSTPRLATGLREDPCA